MRTAERKTKMREGKERHKARSMASLMDRRMGREE